MARKGSPKAPGSWRTSARGERGHAGRGLLAVHGHLHDARCHRRYRQRCGKRPTRSRCLLPGAQRAYLLRRGGVGEGCLETDDRRDREVAARRRFETERERGPCRGAGERLVAVRCSGLSNTAVRVDRDDERDGGVAVRAFGVREVRGEERRRRDGRRALGPAVRVRAGAASQDAQKRKDQKDVAKTLRPSALDFVFLDRHLNDEAVCLRHHAPYVFDTNAVLGVARSGLRRDAPKASARPSSVLR